MLEYRNLVIEKIEKEKKRKEKTFLRCPNYEKRSQKADDERFLTVYRGLKLAADEKRKEKDFCLRPPALSSLFVVGVRNSSPAAHKVPLSRATTASSDETNGALFYSLFSTGDSVSAISARVSSFFQFEFAFRN